MDSPWSLEGKRILITGATKGIGKAITEECLKLKASVFIVSRSKEDIENQLSTYKAAGGDAAGINADVSTRDGQHKIFEAVSKHWKEPLDVLINNAGINIRKPTMEYGDEDFRQIMATNMESAWELSRLFYPQLKASKGNIVNLGSVATHKALKTSTAAYAMSKGAVEGMTRFLANEWGADGIRVNCVLPWYTLTPLASHVLKDEEKRAKILDRTPLGRMAQPEEVARGVVFLAMPAASFVTGICMPVDGGFLASGLL